MSRYRASRNYNPIVKEEVKEAKEKVPEPVEELVITEEVIEEPNVPETLIKTKTKTKKYEVE